MIDAAHFFTPDFQVDGSLIQDGSISYAVTWSGLAYGPSVTCPPGTDDQPIA